LLPKSDKKVLTLWIMSRTFRNFASVQIFFGALVAQSVEHFLGKEEVGGSNPLEGSIKHQPSTINISKQTRFTHLQQSD
jgi:hypothetical protein